MLLVERSAGNILDSDRGITTAIAQHVRSIEMTGDRVRGNLVSVNGNVAAIVVMLALSKSHLKGVINVSGASEALPDYFKQRISGSRICLSGDVATKKAMLDVTLEGIMWVITKVLVAIFFLTENFLRSCIAVAAI